MNRRPVEWLQGLEDDDELESRELHFRVAGSWVATDSDQLLLPIVVVDKSGIEVEEEYRAVLKQYGGEGLLNDMLMSDQSLQEGSEWLLLRTGNLLTVEPA